MISFLFSFGGSLLVTLGINAILWLWLWLVPVKVVRVRRIGWTRALGLALPGLILLTPGGDTPYVLRHEMVHQKQFRRYSPLGTSCVMAFYYGLNFFRLRRSLGRWPSFWELWAANPLEIEAGIPGSPFAHSSS